MQVKGFAVDLRSRGKFFNGYLAEVHFADHFPERSA